MCHQPWKRPDYFISSPKFFYYLTSMDWLKVFKNTVRENKLLESGDAVLIGLSGGPDSVALLHLLSRIQKEMKLSINAVYINHQIRKKAACIEEEFCQKLCDRYGIELDIVSEDIPALAQKRKKGLEETAREFRYEVFDLLAAEDGYDKIALGHHADDRVETVLFRILRGTGSAGVAGIPIMRDKCIRPLYDFTKKDILAYLKKNKLSFCLDESNIGTDFSRNYIRNELLPRIRKRINPRVDRALLNLSEITGEEERFLEQVVKKYVKKTVNITPGGKLVVALERFRSYDLWLKRRLLRYCLKLLSEKNLTPDKESVDRLLGLGYRTLTLADGLQAITADDKLVICQRKKVVFEGVLAIDRPLKLKNLGLNFKLRQGIKSSVILNREKRSKVVTLDSGKIFPPLIVRNIRPGDRFIPLGLSGTKKVGDYLTDKKIPVIYRDEIPVVCDKEGIIWLVGYEIADRVKVDHQTEKVLTIEVSAREKSRVQTF